MVWKIKKLLYSYESLIMVYKQSYVNLNLYNIGWRSAFHLFPSNFNVLHMRGKHVDCIYIWSSRSAFSLLAFSNYVLSHALHDKLIGFRLDSLHALFSPVNARSYLEEEVHSCCMIFHLMWLCKITTDIITVTQNKGFWPDAGVLSEMLLKYSTDRDGCYQCSQLSNSVISFSDFKKPLLSMKRLVLNTFKLICFKNVSMPSRNLILIISHCWN